MYSLSVNVSGDNGYLSEVYSECSDRRVMVHYLESGQIYTVNVYNFSEYEMTNTILADASPAVETVSMGSLDNALVWDGVEQLTFVVSPFFQPTGAYSAVSWSTNGDPVLAVEPYEENPDWIQITVVGYGTTELTVTTENGVSYSHEMTVTAPVQHPALNLNEELDLSILAQNSVQYTLSVEESGYYGFVSEWITVDNCGYNFNFTIENIFDSITVNGTHYVYLESGNTYTVTIENWHEYDLTSTVCVKKAAEPDSVELYDKQIEWDGSEYIDAISPNLPEGSYAAVTWSWEENDVLQVTTSNGKTASCTITVTNPEENTQLGSGTCGANVNWVLSNDGTLTISGSGDMEYYMLSGEDYAPWYEYRDQILKLVIESGVTDVGGSAFRDCANLAEVVLPETVTVIQAAAFEKCASLQNITLPGSLTKICGNAFSGSGLTQLHIPAAVTQIQVSPVRNCQNLQSVTVAEGNESYSVDNGVFVVRPGPSDVEYYAEQLR